MSVKNGINSWAGSVLRVNLTTGAITTEDTLPKYKPYIGGMGLGYKVIWDEVPLDSDPLGPAAKAVFAIGPLTASGVPYSGRMNISFLSCFSKGHSIVDAHMGGHFAHALKYAGYDAVIVEGQSDHPVYLKIEDEKVSLEDASHVWGRGTFETTATLAKENGPEFDVVTIGPAGENLVPMSCMVTSFGNSGGGGVGAVLGSKKLKAIVCRGTGAFKIARPMEVRLLSNYMIKDLVGGNNNHTVPTIPQSWSEYSATSSNRWQGGPASPGTRRRTAPSIWASSPAARSTSPSCAATRACSISAPSPRSTPSSRAAAPPARCAATPSMRWTRWPITTCRRTSPTPACRSSRCSSGIRTTSIRRRARRSRARTTSSMRRMPR